jgi:hypothetical protein
MCSALFVFRFGRYRSVPNHRAKKVKPFLAQKPFVVGLLFVSVVSLAVWIGHLIQGSERNHLFRARAVRDLGLVQQQLRAMESGVYSVLKVLSKPFSLATLAMAVREALTAESAHSNPNRIER